MKELIKWTDDYSVGVKRFDKEHQVLIALLNRLHCCISKNETEEIIDTALKELIDYIENHFASEEVYFKLYNYPLAESHIREHESFKVEVDSFLKDYEKGEKLLASRLLAFLSNWVTNHIRKTDKKYTEFFNSRGVK